MTPLQDEFIAFYEKLRDKLIIEKFELDDEVSHQPSLHQEAGEQWAKALSMRDSVENQASVIQAELYGRYRQDALDNGEKITEDRLKFKVACSEKLIHIQDEAITWKYISSLFWKLCESFEQRARMLDNLGRLHNSGWFDKPFIGKMPDRKAVADGIGQEQNRARTERAQRFNRS